MIFISVWSVIPHFLIFKAQIAQGIITFTKILGFKKNRLGRTRTDGITGAVIPQWPDNHSALVRFYKHGCDTSCLYLHFRTSEPVLQVLSEKYQRVTGKQEQGFQKVPGQPHSFRERVLFPFSDPTYLLLLYISFCSVMAKTKLLGFLYEKHFSLCM